MYSQFRELSYFRKILGRTQTKKNTKTQATNHTQTVK